MVSHDVSPRTAVTSQSDMPYSERRVTCASEVHRVRSRIRVSDSTSAAGSSGTAAGSSCTAAGSSGTSSTIGSGLPGRTQELKSISTCRHATQQYVADGRCCRQRQYVADGRCCRQRRYR
eukprot:7343211-Prymnesium_polylepis.1